MNKRDFRSAAFGLQNDPLQELFNGTTLNSKMLNILLKSPKFSMVKMHNRLFAEAKTPLWVNLF